MLFSATTLNKGVSLSYIIAVDVWSELRETTLALGTRDKPAGRAQFDARALVVLIVFYLRLLVSTLL